jgi:hypothetical protein
MPRSWWSLRSTISAADRAQERPTRGGVTIWPASRAGRGRSRDRARRHSL